MKQNFELHVRTVSIGVHVPYVESYKFNIKAKNSDEAIIKLRNKIAVKLWKKGVEEFTIRYVSLEEYKQIEIGGGDYSIKHHFNDVSEILDYIKKDVNLTNKIRESIHGDKNE